MANKQFEGGNSIRKKETHRCCESLRQYSETVCQLISLNWSFFPFILQQYRFSFVIKKYILNFNFSVKTVNTPLSKRCTTNEQIVSLLAFSISWLGYLWPSYSSRDNLQITSCTKARQIFCIWASKPVWANLKWAVPLRSGASVCLSSSAQC